jgi:hypothetical protein
VEKLPVLLTVFLWAGLMDKKSNWFTHFTGLFLRPKNFLVEEEGAVSNGH